MPRYTLTGSGGFVSALVRLGPRESFTSEAGAMFHATANIDIEVATSSGGRSGFIQGALRGIGRALANESFFLSTYQTIDGRPGELGLAPKLPGEMAVIECSGVRNWICAGGSYVGSSQSLTLDARFQGLRGMFSGESLSFMEVQGRGELLVSAFGSIREMEVDGAITVDTGHVVAFEDSLDYSLDRAGGSWLQSFLASEGVTLNFRGNGKLYVQSHNPDEWGRALGGILPPIEEER